MSSEELSKSAKKRANKKARDAAAAEEAPPAPQPKAAAKEKAAPKAAAPPAAKSKAAAPEPKAKAKAAEPKAAKAAQAPPKAEAKSKAAEPKQAAAKAKQSAGKAKAQPKKAKEDEEEVKEDKGPLVYYELDDGSRKDEWEVSTGKSKQQEKQAARAAEKKALADAAAKGSILQAKAHQHIPGLAPVEAQMGKAKAKAKASQAVGAIANISALAAAKEEAPKAVDTVNTSSATIKVPENKIGWVVGPKGANIKLITEKTGIKTMNMEGDSVTVVGSADAVAQAKHAVEELLAKGWMSISYEDFSEEGVQVHPSYFPSLISQNDFPKLEGYRQAGHIIQTIKKQANVEVTIPPTPPDAIKGTKKYRVGLAGNKAAVALGKQIVESIMMYGHHEITHPGLDHKEMEIEPWQYAFIIGKGGSEMKHIQNNYKVKVNIPRPTSANQNVVIVGEPNDIERAVKYIWKQLDESAEPRGRGAADKADDGWGDEGEVEDWMKPYLYSRKH